MSRSAAKPFGLGYVDVRSLYVVYSCDGDSIKLRPSSNTIYFVYPLYVPFRSVQNRAVKRLYKLYLTSIARNSALALGKSISARELHIGLSV